MTTATRAKPTAAEMKRAIAAGKRAGAASVIFDGERIVFNLKETDDPTNQEEAWPDLDEEEA